MKLDFSVTHSLNISHVCGNPNHHLRNNNSAWARAETRLFWKLSSMLRVLFTMTLFQKGV
jgi:hypothetical protein